MASKKTNYALAQGRIRAQKTRLPHVVRGMQDIAKGNTPAKRTTPIQREGAIFKDPDKAFTSLATEALRTKKEITELHNQVFDNHVIDSKLLERKK